MHLAHYIKVQYKTCRLFNREQIFIVRKVLQKINPYDYWISKTEDSVIIDRRFLRQELFALKYQFI